MRTTAFHLACPCVIAMIVAALLTVPSPAQDDPADPPAAPLQTDPATAPESDDDEPSLDELLGIEEDESAATAEEIARQEAEAELQRRLDEEEMRDSFAIALEKMGVSAELLEVAFDPGLGTQRVQEEILTRLDRLIDQARKLQSACAGSAGSSSTQQQPRQPGPQQSQAEQDQQRDAAASDGQATDPPPRQEGNVNTIFEESRTEWGSLPQRVRDMLLQGRREKFSSLYEQLTREYYRRLAEEGSS